MINYYDVGIGSYVYGVQIDELIPLSVKRIPKRNRRSYCIPAWHHANIIEQRKDEIPTRWYCLTDTCKWKYAVRTKHAKAIRFLMRYRGYQLVKNILILNCKKEGLIFRWMRTPTPEEQQKYREHRAKWVNIPQRRKRENKANARNRIREATEQVQGTGRLDNNTGNSAQLDNANRPMCRFCRALRLRSEVCRVPERAPLREPSAVSREDRRRFGRMFGTAEERNR